MARAPAQAASLAPHWLDSTHALWAGAVLLLMLVSLAAGLALYERQQLLNQEQREVAFTARLLERQTTRTFNTIGLAFDHLADELGRHEAAGPALERTLKTLPFLHSLSLVDAQGRVTASTRADNVGIRLDRRLLQAQSRQGASRLGPWLAAPDLKDMVLTADTASGTGAILVLQTLPGEPKHMAQLVGTLDPDYLAGQLLFSLDGIARQAALLDRRGLVLSATDGAGLRAGQHVARAAQALTELTRREDGQFVGTGLSGEKVVAAFRSVRNEALVMVVEQPLSTLMQRWQRQVSWLLAGMLVASLVLAALTAGAWRSLRNHERVRQALEVAQQRQAASEEYLRALIEAAPAPMFVLDSERRYVMINRAFEDFLGVRRDEVLTRHDRLPEALRLLAHHPQHDAPLQNGSGRSHYLEHLVGADGSLREALVAKVALHAEQVQTQAPEGTARAAMGSVIGSITDVTEFRQAQQRIREARDVAEAAHRAKNEFITHLSHSLRTPLQAVLGYSELGQRRAQTLDQAALADMFAEIRTGAHSMLSLVNDLLDLAKLESAAGTMRPAPHDTLELVGRAAQALDELAAQRQVQLRVHPGAGGDPAAPHPTMAWVDPARFVQAMRNVLENALRVSPSGTQVDISWRHTPAGELHWTVHDQGPGIPRDELSRIFEPFFQSSRTRNSSGEVGLGLAISHSILAALGGRLWAENNSGEAGAQLHMALPAVGQRSEAIIHTSFTS